MTSHFEKGLALYDLDRFDSAFAEFNFARPEMPDDARPVMMAARCQYSLKQFKKGLALAEEALGMDPNSVKSLQVYALCSTHLKKERQAREALDKALAIDPEDGFTHYYMAWFMAAQGHWPIALTAIENALYFEPDDATFLAMRSKALTILGKKAEAKDASIEALRNDPEDPRALAQHGLVLRQEGDVVGAMRSYREALRNNPNDQVAREGLLQSVRSRFILYRWMLSFELQLNRLNPQVRSAFTILPYFALRAIATMSKDMEPHVAIILAIVGGLYVLLLFAAWFGPVFLDAIAAVDPELNLILTRPQRIWATALLWTFIVGFCSLIIGFGFHVDPMLVVGFTLVISFTILSFWYRQNKW